jgi:dihydrofolate reductase
MRKSILYIAISLDGYIAGPDEDLSFLDIVQREDEDYGYGDFIQTVDTVIMGRKTYDWIMAHVPEFVHADKTTFIITRTERQSTENTRFHTGDLSDLVRRLKTESGKNIFIEGGAEVVKTLLLDDLIDEYVISIIPVLVGGGTKLFEDGRPQQTLKLISTKQFDSGLVQLHYQREV